MNIRLVSTVVLLAACVQAPPANTQTQPPAAPPVPVASPELPTFRVDPNWPQPLAEENGMQLVYGQVSGIAVDERNGHIWLVHRPGTLLPDEWNAKDGKPVTHRCCKAAATVVELDSAGNYVRGWTPSGNGFEWPKSEHGIYIDPEGNVWVAGNGNEDNQILKFTPDGKFLLQIGRAGKSEGSNSKTQLGRPAHMVLSGDELFVADGYGNRRVVVFDAKTGAYKRHWGAYGTTAPTDDKLPPYDPGLAASESFGNPVHCVRISNDGLVYVCDRQNNRIQVFGPKGDFRREFRVEVQTTANGAVWDMVLSHDPAQKYMYVADGANGRIYIVGRADGKVLGSFGRTGRMAGEFKWIHNLAIDRDGNLYTSEVGFGRRVQKFVRSGGAF
jgi:DNA-binding beta-propeller fold protein YncE